MGIALAKGSLPDAGGAFLLFLTNFIAILVAGTAVFGLLRLPEAGAVEMKEATRKRAVQIIILATVLLVIGLTVASLNAVQGIDDQITAYSAVQAWLGDAPYQINQVTVQNSVVDVTLLGNGELPPLDSLARDLGQQLGRPVEVTVHLIPETSMRFPP